MKLENGKLYRLAPRVCLLHVHDTCEEESNLVAKLNREDRFMVLQHHTVKRSHPLITWVRVCGVKGTGWTLLWNDLREVEAV